MFYGSLEEHLGRTALLGLALLLAVLEMVVVLVGSLGDRGDDEGTVGLLRLASHTLGREQRNCGLIRRALVYTRLYLALSLGSRIESYCP